MGTKRCRKGQHVFLYLACLILIQTGFSGCAHCLKKKMFFLPGNRSEELYLEQTRDFIRKKKYKAALLEIKNFPSELEDQALFQKGVVYASAANPQKDFNKSIICFQCLIDNFPESKVYNEAVILAALLQDHVAQEKEKAELIGSNSGKKNISLKTLLKEKNQQIATLQREIESLKEQLKKLKEIDLGIEEKKRETLPK